MLGSPTSTARPVTAPRSMIERPFGRQDRWIIALFIAAPILLFSLPALAGHPALAGDNLIQNYPLRVLSGRQLASGHLPLWNPLAFSGFPLLGAMNAGALFPATWLFAVLPDAVAWIVNLASAYAAAATGMYFLARWFRLGRLASVAGAISYGFMGAMLGHMVHLGLIQGQALLPWATLALVVIADRVRGEAATGSLRIDLVAAGWPLLLLAVCMGLAVLTGEPRSIADLFVVLLVVGAWTLLRQERGGVRQRVHLLAGYGAVTVLGLMLSAVQLLTGRAVVSYSQRSNLSAWFIGSGSLRPTWTALLAIPTILGGNGLLHQPRWFVEYNLPEVTGYAGLLALVGLFAACVQCFGRERRRRLPSYIPLFLVLVVVGLVLAWGSYTPAFNGVIHIPVINRTRLQSRNLAIVDLALAVLLAWFVDRVLAGDADGASLQGWRRWVTLSPLFATVLLVLVALVAPSQLASGLSAQADVVGMERFLWPWLAVAGLLAGACATLLYFWHRLAPARARRLLLVLFCLDFGIFFLGCTTGLVSGGADQLPTRSSASSLIGTKGRFALVDPSLANLNQFITLGKPNTNVFTGIPSVQGYGSLIPEFYGEVTDAHTQDGLSACSLAEGRLRQLRLSAVAAGTNVLAPMIFDTTVRPPVPLEPTLATPCPEAPEVATHDSRWFYFGQLRMVSELFLPPRTTTVGHEAPRVSLIGATGKRVASTSTVQTQTGGWRISFEQPVSAAGLRVASGALNVAEGGTLRDTEGNLFSLNGSFQRAMDGKGWRLEATTATYQVFRTTRELVPKIALEPHLPGSSVRSVTTTVRGADDAVVTLVKPTTLVRSVSFVPGWTATYVPVNGGVSQTAPVLQHDLVQAVQLPAGSWKVSFRYHPKGLVLGLLFSGFGAAILVVSAFVLWRHGRRRGIPSHEVPSALG